MMCSMSLDRSLDTFKQQLRSLYDEKVTKNNRSTSNYTTGEGFFVRMK